MTLPRQQGPLFQPELGHERPGAVDERLPRYPVQGFHIARRILFREHKASSLVSRERTGRTTGNVEDQPFVNGIVKRKLEPLH